MLATRYAGGDSLAMSVSEPESQPPRRRPRWFQFSLRTLLLWAVSAAALCSIGACTDWGVPIGIAATGGIGGIVGVMIAGPRRGFPRGALYGVLYSLVALILCATCGGFFWLWGSLWRSITVLGLGAVVGGGLGGYGARLREKGATRIEAQH